MTTAISINKFIADFDMPVTAPTIKNWINANIYFLIENEIVGVTKTAKRNRYVIFKPERLKKLYFGIEKMEVKENADR